MPLPMNVAIDGPAPPSRVALPPDKKGGHYRGVASIAFLLVRQA